MCIIFALFSLPSCVYIGVQGKVGTESQHRPVCTSGSAKENKKCREELEILTESIEQQKLN